MDTNAVRERLDGERERLSSVRDQLLGDPAAQAPRNSVNELSAYDQHPGDIGTEMFEQEKDASILEQVRAQLDEVERAAHRLEDGNYGICEACGRPIGDARLEAIPAARFCLEDQARAERELGLSRAQP